MLSWIGKQIGDPGWKLRCIDPPIAWLRLNTGDQPEIGIRIQLTCFLSSKRAQPVHIRETRLLVAVGDRQIESPATRVTDVGGGRFPEPPGHSITGYETEHALIDYASKDRDMVDLLSRPGDPVAAVVEAMVNTSDIYRRIATFDIVRRHLAADGVWTQIETGR